MYSEFLVSGKKGADHCAAPLLPSLGTDNTAVDAGLAAKDWEEPCHRSEEISDVD